MLVVTYLQHKWRKGRKRNHIKLSCKTSWCIPLDLCHYRQVATFHLFLSFSFASFFCNSFNTHTLILSSALHLFFLSLFPFHFPCVSFLYLSCLDQVVDPAGSSSHVGPFRNLMVSARVYLYSGFHQALYSEAFSPSCRLLLVLDTLNCKKIKGQTLGYSLISFISE